MKRSDEDARWMRECLRLAARAKGAAAPNPRVGGVVVRKGERIAAGYHVRDGREHGEAIALARAGERAKGATLYVNLEPCAHQGRTPPCVEHVLASGVRRVVIGAGDPDPRTAGSSIRRLRRAGLSVHVGVEAEACRRANEGFFSRIERGRPFTTLKLAASLDGRIATSGGESRWITGEAARVHVHRLREKVDAVCVGSGTVAADDPELTARRGARTAFVPKRVVIDSAARTPATARLIAVDPSSAWILTRKAAPPARRRALERAGAALVDVRAARGHLDLGAAWRALAKRGINDLLVEGGGGLAAALVRRGLVDRLLWYTAPLLIGEEGRPVLGALGVGRLARAPRPDVVEMRRLGDDWLITAEW